MDDKRLKLAKEALDSGSYDRETIEYIFPELKEIAYDDTMKEMAIKAIYAPEAQSCIKSWGINPDDVIAWLEEKVIPLKNIILNVWELGNYWKLLTKGVCTTEHGRQIDYIIEHWKEGTPYIKSFEKQDEQKSTNTKTKFHEGDWVVCDGCCYLALIVNINGDKYEIEFADGAKGYHRSGLIHKAYHRWTIQDAKDGDIVVDKSNGTIGIFQSIGHHPDGGSYNDPSYCFLHCRYDDGFFYADFENGNMIDADDLIPATKEQRDRLEKEITKAGYRWNKEEHKLEKI